MNKADAEGITATLPNGRQESLAWSELGPKTISKIVPARQNADDWLAAGLLSLTGRDVAGAERYFDKRAAAGRRDGSL